MIDFKLTPIENDGKRVLTTAQLAEAYGTTEKRISENFNRNKDRYIEGKHFYCLKGAELKAFINYSANCGVVDKRTPSLYLWTERGSLLHAKSINTDKAWEVHDFLVDTYFRAREINNFYNESICKKFEVLEQKIDALNKKVGMLEKNSEKRTDSIVKSLNKNADIRMDNIITDIKESIDASIMRTADTTIQGLIPCFIYIRKKLKKLYKKLSK